MGFYRKKALMVSAYALGVLLMYGIASWFEYDMGRHVAAIRASRTERASRADAESRLGALKVESAAADPALAVLRSALPAEDALIDFPRQAAALARVRGLEFSFAFGDSVLGTTTTPGSVAFSASGRGSGDAWAGFLSGLESGQNVVSIDAFDMTAKSGGSYDATLHGKVFSR